MRNSHLTFETCSKIKKGKKHENCDQGYNFRIYGNYLDNDSGIPIVFVLQAESILLNNSVSGDKNHLNN